MAQYPKIESTGSIGSIVLAILEVQVGIKGHVYNALGDQIPSGLVHPLTSKVLTMMARR